MSKGPNWNDIERCPIWKHLGTIECDNCDTMEQCWGSDVVLPTSRRGDRLLKKTLKQEPVRIGGQDEQK